VRPMSRLVLLVTVALAAAASAGCGSSRPATVRVDGRIGRFRIDVTTEAQLVASAGQPDRVEDDFAPLRKRPVGHTLYYRCGRRCETAYSIARATGRLSDFESNSPDFVTERGSHVGMRAAEAARREGKKLAPGCGTGPYIDLRLDRHHTVTLAAWGGKVREIIYLGPHSVYYEGLC